MPIEPIRDLTLIESEAEADVYLERFLSKPENRSMDVILSKPENRSMDVINRDAEKIKNLGLRTYFITKAREMVK
jgi:hypothetical protein